MLVALLVMVEEPPSQRRVIHACRMLGFFRGLQELGDVFLEVLVLMRLFSMAIMGPGDVEEHGWNLGHGCDCQ